MSSDSSKISQLPAARLAFLELVARHVKRDTWTSAEGAMLISGALPPPKATEIPNDAPQLEDPAKPATQSQMLEASAVLRNYREDVENGDMPLGDSVSPVEFLEWCEGDRRARYAEKLPEFLRHIYTLESYPRFTQTPEDELLTLRKAIAAEVQLKPPGIIVETSHGASCNDPSRASVNHKKLRSALIGFSFRGDLSSVIPKAIEKASDPTDHHAVWEELVKLAELKTAPLLGITDAGKLRVRNATGSTNTYEKSALRKSLANALLKVNKNR